MNKRIGVTGASGFIGKLLINTLYEQGYHITALTRSNTNFPENVKVINGDLLDDKKVKLFLHDIGIIVHLAARQLPPEDLFFRENVSGTFNLVKNMAEFPVKQLLYLSTMAVYGDQGEKIITEKDTCKPTSSYGITKYLAETICRYWETTTNNKLTILRPFNVYGKGSKIGVVYNMLKNVKEGKPIIIYGDGMQKRDFLYVDDVIAAIVIALKEEKEGVFNLGYGKDTTVLDLAEQIKKIYAQKVKISFKQNEAGKANRIEYSINKAQSVLGWTAKVTLEEGLNKIL